MAFALALLTSAAAPRGERIAVLPLTALGSTADAAHAVERVLHVELEKLVGERVRYAAALRAKGAQVERALERCDGAPACIAEVVGAIGWETFLVGNVAGLGDARVITLRLYDARSGSERGRVEPVQGDCLGGGSGQGC